MNTSTNACIAFEKDIHLFVDHELVDDGVSRLAQHLEACSSCADFVDDLRQLAALHRQAGPMIDEAIAGMVDKHALFESITKTLLADKRNELASLFYELGKAYVLVGNDAMSGSLKRSVVPLVEAVDIRATTAHGRQLARKGIDLEAEAGAERESGSLFSRSRRLFSSSSRANAGALTNGRRLLEEALRIEPELDEARMYLGFHHMLTGRFDRARIEFRRVYRTSSSSLHRMMAAQMLGNVHASVGDYGQAIECYEEVVSSDLLDTEPRLFTSIVNLAVNCAKAGRVVQAVEHFKDLVSRFPTQIEKTRALLARKQGFTALLERQDSLQQDLRRNVPSLFAA